MNKTNAEIWREVFATWPAQFRRKGVLVPSYGEPIPFIDFVMNSDLLIVERATPDNVGARRIAIPLQFIEGLKYTEPLKTDQFLKSGYTKGVTLKPAPTASIEPVVSQNPASVAEQQYAAPPLDQAPASQFAQQPIQQQFAQQSQQQ